MVDPSYLSSDRTGLSLPGDDSQNLESLDPLFAQAEIVKALQRLSKVRIGKKCLNRVSLFSPSDHDTIDDVNRPGAIGLSV